MKLLNFQYHTLNDQTALHAVRQSQSRLKALSLIHHNLYESWGEEYVRIADYLIDLVVALKIYFRNSRHLNFHYHLDTLDFKLNQAEPLGLLLNEVITNCIKHAFGKSGHGDITISMLGLSNGEVMFTISDNGKLLAADFDIENSPTLGVKLIRGLCEQLDGELNFLNSKDGFTVNLIFQKEI